MRHLLKLTDLTKEEFFKILRRGEEHRKNRRLAPSALAGKNVAIMFEKSSTRTRLSFHVAIVEMGGNVVPLEASAMQIGRGETIEDTAEVFSRYLDAVMIRANSHQSLESVAAMNRIPVINGLTDRHHPCQGLADYMTMAQYGLPVEGGIRLAFVGEGNNVFNSLALGALHAGIEVRIASPAGYEADPGIIALLERNGVMVRQYQDPAEAVEGAHVVYTDVWISMGQEKEAETRKKIFAPYQVNESLLKGAHKDHMVLHCLPAHRGEEITDDVMKRYGHHIFDQAENRLHVQKAVLEWIFGSI